MVLADKLTEHIKQDILNVLKESLKAIKTNNPIRLKELSNQTIHNSSIHQDPHSILTAVLTYTLAKIFERPRYKKYKTWNFFYQNTIENLSLAIQALQKNQIEKYDHAIHNLLQSINKLEHKFKKYIKETLQQAKISKASRIHEHGISAARTAELLGISEWELMSYTGQTGIHDAPYSQSKDIRTRIKFTRSLFK